MFITVKFIIPISNFYTKQGSYRIGMLRTALRSARSPLSPHSVGKLPAAAFRNRHNVTNYLSNMDLFDLRITRTYSLP